VGRVLDMENRNVSYSLFFAQPYLASTLALRVARIVLGIGGRKGNFLPFPLCIFNSNSDLNLSCLQKWCALQDSNLRHQD